jgi:Dolichyl-phosphate-mannose-protein mannosyltransferase
VFRAHPLFFQTVLSLVYTPGVSDIAGRVLAVGFGLATVWLTYKLGALLYGRRAGMIAALLLAVMPYHVVVSRQVLLDGPMTFCATLTLYLLARYCDSPRRLWLYAAGAALGLTFLSKEPSILFVGAVYTFFALAHDIDVRLRDLLGASAVFLLIASPFPLSIVFAGRTGTGNSFLAWQLFRRPNHSWIFYATTVPRAMGVLVVATAALGLWLLRDRWGWREALLASWIVVPAFFFELWPVKGFQYLLPLAPPVAVLAGRFLAEAPQFIRRRLRVRAGSRAFAVALPALVVVTLVVPSWQRIQPSSSGKFLAGSGGVPGGREAGLWVRDHIPEGAKILALGPSMANILEFYGRRKAYGLSVSANPLHRNPTYEPVVNPDHLIRTNELQYIAWDSYSASRSPYFSSRLRRYVDRYHGRAVHSETVTITDHGKRVEKPVITVYEVRP